MYNIRLAKPNRTEDSFGIAVPGFFTRSLFLTALAVLLLFLCPSPVGHAQIYKTTADVNVRKQAGMDSKVITCLKKGTRVKKTGADGHWIAIKTKGRTGYIYYKYLKKAAGKKLYVKADAVNLRRKPTTKSASLGLLYRGRKVLVLGSRKGWYKVKTGKGKTGYVCKKYMSKKKVKSASGKAAKKKSSFQPDKNTGRRLKEAAAHTRSIRKYRAAAIKKARTYLGVKYSQKKRNKKGYADCSSLMRDVFRGVTGQMIGDNSTAQVDRMNEFLYPVRSAYDAAPGDILYHLSADNHCGIYLGDGKVLHASQGKGKVVISSFPKNGTFWEYGCNAALFCALR